MNPNQVNLCSNEIDSKFATPKKRTATPGRMAMPGGGLNKSDRNSQCARGFPSHPVHNFSKSGKNYNQHRESKEQTL